jgi:LmbE family N-acetylglucosaminyl deacetylase
MDYKYNFELAATIKIDFNRRKYSFVWPKLDIAYDTVLLKLKVKNKAALVKISLPYLNLKIADKNICSKQYLERNNYGIRYFNLTDFAKQASPGDEIKLSSNKLLWDSANIELLVFNNKIDVQSKLLVIAPHPDDAELAAFGLYSKFDTHIVTITAGEGGRIDYCQAYSDDPKIQRQFKAKIRILDSISVPLFGGVTPQKALNLCYFNGKLAEMYQNPDRAVKSELTGISDVRQFRKFNVSTLMPSSNGAATWENLVNDLSTVLKKIAPDIIVLPHPLLDRHQDHCFSSLAVFETMRNLKMDNGKFFFYVTHSNFSSKYPYGPRHSPITLPPNFVDNELECSVYSHSLSWQEQIEKIFALDAMHDIAPIPGISESVVTKLKYKLFYKSKYIEPWLKYYRRAIRSNELFLVMPFSKVDALIQKRLV